LEKLFSCHVPHLAVHSALASGEDNREESSLDLNWATEGTKYFIHADGTAQASCPDDFLFCLQDSSSVITYFSRDLK
jgi:hypothetical protein